MANHIAPCFLLFVVDIYVSTVYIHGFLNLITSICCSELKLLIIQSIQYALKH